MATEKKCYLTPEGLRRIKKEYEALKKMRALKIKGEFPSVQESEDLNPEYFSLQEDLGLLEMKITELEEVLKNVALIKKPAKDKQNIVDLGAKVVVWVDSQKDEFEIVGSLEANPSLGKISNESPVGKALLGHQVGDKVVVSSPTETIYKIEKIKY